MSWPPKLLDELTALGLLPPMSPQGGQNDPSSFNMPSQRHPSQPPAPASSGPSASSATGMIDPRFIATLAQNPALISPVHTSNETDFDRAVLEALRVLATAQQVYGTQPPVPRVPNISQSAQSAAGHPYQQLDPRSQWMQPQGHGQPLHAGGSGSQQQQQPYQQSMQGYLPMPPPSQDPTLVPAPAQAPVPRRRNNYSGSASPMTPTTSTASTPATPVAGPSAQANEAQEQGDADYSDEALSEDKRRRNTAASARFRAKKKEQITNLERTISDLTGRTQDLEREAGDLRRENGWLREIVMLRGRAISGSSPTLPPQPPQQPQLPPPEQQERKDALDAKGKGKNNNT